MSSKDKVLKDIKNNPKGVSFKTLKKVLEQNGFVLKSVNGSHHTFKRLDQRITIPKHKPIKEIYVRLVLKFIQGDNQ